MASTVYKIFFLICCILDICFVQGDCCHEQLFRHQFFIGPELYYAKRETDLGAYQKGWLYGGRLGYDYIRRYAFYVGADGMCASGRLEGHSGSRDKVKSHFTDANVEGRFGYTLATKACSHASLTPFIGIGYFWEINNYQHPSPMPVHFRNEFYYIPVGFLSRIFIHPQLSVGINFKARFLLEGNVKVTKDPNVDDFTSHYAEKVQYRLDIPISYYFCHLNRSWGVSLIPFYEYRNYGRKANFPFDFPDTKFRFYGVSLRALYVF